MNLTELRKAKARRVMGIDSSTNSFAFGIIEDGRLVHWGEIDFAGTDVFRRTRDARRKVDALVDKFECDFVAIESAVMVRNVAVAIKMAYVFGSILGSLLATGAQVVEKKPLEWQKGIGNAPLTKSERLQIQAEFPGKSKSWYQNAGREVRKQRTKDFVKDTFGVEIQSDNVSDAIGIAYYAYNSLTRRA